MVRYVHKSTERMIDLAQRFTDDTGLKARALNLAAKEILLAQASDWPSMLHKKNYPDFAREAFSQNISSFATVFESLGSNNTSTEWLTNTERAHQIFPWINYRIFSKKK
jgi:1,4-alpha-glucan branching enzyme